MATKRDAAAPASVPAHADGPHPARVAARLARQVEVALAEADVTGSQYRLLMYLDQGASAASRLASVLAVSPPSVTGVVDVLVARGLVARETVPGDRRQVAHVLTPAGQAVLAAADAAVERRLDLLLSHAPQATVRRRAAEGLHAWQVVLDSCNAAPKAELERRPA